MYYLDHIVSQSMHVKVALHKIGKSFCAQKHLGETAFICSTFSSVRLQRWDLNITKGKVWPSPHLWLHDQSSDNRWQPCSLQHAASKKDLFLPTSCASREANGLLILFFWRKRKEQGSFMALMEQNCWETPSAKGQYRCRCVYTSLPDPQEQSNPILLGWQRGLNGLWRSGLSLAAHGVVMGRR